MRRIGSPILFSRRWMASAASASGMWSVMEGARSRRPLDASRLNQLGYRVTLNPIDAAV
jgi:hypothetical protein